MGAGEAQGTQGRAGLAAGSLRRLLGLLPAQGAQGQAGGHPGLGQAPADDALIAAIGRALRMLKASEDWQRGVGIPYAATFLNGERWHDADSLPEVHASSGNEEVYGWQD